MNSDTARALMLAVLAFVLSLGGLFLLGWIERNWKRKRERKRIEMLEHLRKRFDK